MWDSIVCMDYGLYVISLLACSTAKLPEEEKRGGTEAPVPRPIRDRSQSITIHSIEDGRFLSPKTPSLAKEFL